jgi:hypothetical protein
MPRAIRRVSILWLIFACLFSSAAWSQTTRPGRGTAPRRRPFAKPGTPRREERIRYVDIKHIKAELTLDAKQKQVSGTVTHTSSPLHPYLTQVELDCALELKVNKVTKADHGSKAIPCKFEADGGKLKVTLDKAHGPDDTLEPSSTSAVKRRFGSRWIMSCKVISCLTAALAGRSSRLNMNHQRICSAE